MITSPAIFESVVSAVSLTSVVLSGSDLVASWTGSGGIDAVSYRVYYRADAGSYAPSNYFAAAGSPATLTNFLGTVGSSGLWDFQVTTIGADGTESSPSNETSYNFSGGGGGGGSKRGRGRGRAAWMHTWLADN